MMKKKNKLQIYLNRSRYMINYDLDDKKLILCLIILLLEMIKLLFLVKYS